MCPAGGDDDANGGFPAVAGTKVPFQLIAEHACDAVLWTTHDSVVCWASPSVREVLGRSVSELVGHRAVDFVHLDDRDDMEESITRLQPGQTAVFRVRWCLPAGGHIPVGCTFSALPADAGSPGGVVGYLRNVEPLTAAEETIRRLSERLAAALESELGPHMFLSAVRGSDGEISDFMVEEVNPAAGEYLGRSADRLRGARLSDLVAGVLSADAIARLGSAIESGAPLILNEHPYRGGDDDTVRRFDIRAARVGDGLSFAWRDVTEAFESARALADSERQFRQLAESVGDVVRVFTLQGRHQWVSPSVTKMLGYTPEELLDTPGIDLMHPDDIAAAVSHGTKAVTQGKSAAAPRRTRLLHADGHWVWTETTNSFSYNPDGSPAEIYAVSRDVSAQVAAEEALRVMAQTDVLTGMLNRAAVLARLESELADEARGDRPVGVLFCDLDDLKRINDSRGHAAGDYLLSTTAHRVRTVVGDQGEVARFGGDELLVLLPDVTDLPAATALADRLRAAIAEPMPAPDGLDDLVGTVSIGVALSQVGDNADQVISRADAAMYRAKAAGRNRVVSHP